MNYSLDTIAAVTGGTLRGANRTVCRVATDSRNHLADPATAIFVALAGKNRDGHDYIDDFYRRGVRSFLVSRLPDDLREGSFVLVGDTLEALQRWAAYHRGCFQGQVVAITGSHGKTTVKEWIAQRWPEGAGKLFRSPQSYNSQLGVALSLLMIEGDERVALIEAGISQPGEMERLERMIRPTIGLFTNLGDSHSAHFESPAQQLAEKMILFRGVDTLIRRDDLPVVQEGIEARNHALVEAFYRRLGIAPLPAETLQPIAMRLEQQEGVLGSHLLNDSYNNDLTSLEIALDRLSHTATGPKVLILSDILQSGLPPRELYGRVADLALHHGIRQVIGIGAAIGSARSLFTSDAQFFETTEAFIRQLDKSRFAGKDVLIKGSRPFGFERISRLLEKRTHTTTLEVNLTAMADNLRHYRNLLAPSVGVMVMVKAHAYGHGSCEVAAMLQHEGVDYLAVAFADEGIALREGGIHLPIVVLNSDPGSFAVMADYGLEPEIYSFSSLRAYAAEMRTRGVEAAPIHLKFDTGMHRLGFVEAEIDPLVDELKTWPSVRVATLFSHLAAAEDPAEDAYTRDQIALFERFSEKIRRGLGDPSIRRHLCNSAGIERFPEAHYELVRLGIGLYGTENADLRTVSTLSTHIVQVRELNPGDTVGYNRRGLIERPSRIATLPIGYADGLNRRLGNGNASFRVGETLCPTIGNICMDTCMIDVTGVAAAEGDPVVVFGDRPTARELADRLGTISYEVMTSISPRIKPLYIRE